jgi:hypothetical protein
MLNIKNTRRRLGAAAALAAMLLSGGAAASTADLAIQPFAASYKVKVGIASARSTVELTELAPNRYEIVSVTEATGIAGLFKRGQNFERATFRVVDGEIIAESLVRQDTLSGQDRDCEIYYRPEQGEADIVYLGETRTVKIPRNTFNPLLMQIALMQDLARGTPPEYYNILDHVGLRQYTVTLGSEDEVSTPLGGFEAVPVDLINETENAGTRVFASPKAEWIAVKVEARKGNDVKATLRLDRIGADARS